VSTPGVRCHRVDRNQRLCAVEPLADALTAAALPAGGGAGSGSGTSSGSGSTGTQPSAGTMKLSLQ
jgi:hypothetical protein